MEVTPTGPGLSVAEVAELLTQEDGQPVKAFDVQRIEAQALRKLRRLLGERGMSLDTLLPDG